MVTVGLQGTGPESTHSKAELKGKKSNEESRNSKSRPVMAVHLQKSHPRSPQLLRDEARIGRWQGDPAGGRNKQTTPTGGSDS